MEARREGENGCQFYTYLGVPQNPYLGMHSVSVQSVSNMFLVYGCKLGPITSPANCLSSCEISCKKSSARATVKRAAVQKKSNGGFVPYSPQSDWRSDYFDTPLQAQAEVTSEEKLVTMTDHHADELDQEVVRFLDENVGQNTGFTSVLDNVTLRDSAQENAELADFLSRPVRIASFTWNESDAIGTYHAYNPWHLFFNDARIKYKTNNYAFIQCDLKIKVLINASPFYYGAMIMAYQPLPNLCATYNMITADAGTGYFIPYSQRPHLWIYPTANAAGEMTLPFFLNRNWLKIQSAADFINMGSLMFINYTALASANGATGSGVTVQVYAWAENVRLSGPSVGLAMQAKNDEYSGPISGPASAIAEAAGALARIPLISKFATATQMGARGVANGARLLGFTNTPVISDVQPFRPAAIAPMSTSEISYPVEKLTLDPKNELTIDPNTVGLGSVDELSICHLVQKESYLCTTTWATSNATDDILFSSLVAPSMYYTDGQTNAKIFMTPMCWLSYNFVHWRGDIIFRFKFVASPFHKGRVRISFDPAGYSGENIISDSTSTTAVFTTVVDLGKDTDVELRVPFQQAYPWLRENGFPIAGNTLWSTSASPTFAYDSALHNGTIVMRVLTALSAPVSTSSIPVMVFVRGAENLEFANPSNVFNDNSTLYSWLPVQASDDIEETVLKVVAGGQIHKPAPERCLVNYGESINNLRQVLRRASLAYIRQGTADTASVCAWSTWMVGRLPPCPGYDVGGLDSAHGLVATGSTFAYNYSKLHPITYISAPFIGVRGSVIHHYNFTRGRPIQHLRVVRCPHSITTALSENFSAINGATPATTAYNALLYVSGGSSGHALTNQQTQAGLSVSMPYYSNLKFSSAAPVRGSTFATSDGSAYDTFLLETIFDDTLTDNNRRDLLLCDYASIGTDFTVHFFLNVPTLFRYASVPVPTN